MLVKEASKETQKKFPRPTIHGDAWKGAKIGGGIGGGLGLLSGGAGAAIIHGLHTGKLPNIDPEISQEIKRMGPKKLMLASAALATALGALSGGTEGGVIGAGVGAIRKHRAKKYPHLYESK